MPAIRVSAPLTSPPVQLSANTTLRPDCWSKRATRAADIGFRVWGSGFRSEVAVSFLNPERRTLNPLFRYNFAVNSSPDEPPPALLDPHLFGTLCGLFSAFIYTCANSFLRAVHHCDPVWVSTIRAVPTVLL